MIEKSKFLSSFYWVSYLGGWVDGLTNGWRGVTAGPVTAAFMIAYSNKEFQHSAKMSFGN